MRASIVHVLEARRLGLPLATLVEVPAELEAQVLELQQHGLAVIETATPAGGSIETAALAHPKGGRRRR